MRSSKSKYDGSVAYSRTQMVNLKIDQFEGDAFTI